MADEPKKPEPVLIERDINGETWKRLRAHYEERLERLRKQNDSLTLPELQTAVQRGRIAEIKRLLDLPNPAPAIVNNDADFKD